MDKASLGFYQLMSKNGKPQPHEFTVLACFLLTAPNASNPIVIALGTGTKCLPGSKLSPDGSTLNDCHAEVIARRNLIAWLFSELDSALEARPSVLEMDPLSKRFQLRDGYKLHFYVSQPPCGDCAILRSSKGEKALMLRTGAKAIRLDPSSCPLVPNQSSMDSQELGLVRRKPGKGEPTLSMSCSDKIARWVLLGLQGSLLSALLLHPLGLESITIALPIAMDEEAKKEASEAFTSSLCLRFKSLSSSPPFSSLTLPKVLAADPPPPHLSLTLDSGTKVGAGSVISWHAPPLHLMTSCRGENDDLAKCNLKQPKPALGHLEVLSGSDGSKLGLSKADRAQCNPVHFPSISRYSLFNRFLRLLDGIKLKVSLVEASGAHKEDKNHLSHFFTLLTDEGDDSRSHLKFKGACATFSGMRQRWESCPSKTFWLTGVKECVQD